MSHKKKRAKLDSSTNMKKLVKQGYTKEEALEKVNSNLAKEAKAKAKAADKAARKLGK